MNSFLLVTAAFIVLTVALGLVRIFRGCEDADRMMAIQLLGTGGIGVMLVLAGAGRGTPALDVALTLALLTAFASVAFVKNSGKPPSDSDR